MFEHFLDCKNVYVINKREKVYKERRSFSRRKLFFLCDREQDRNNRKHSAGLRKSSDV